MQSVIKKSTPWLIGCVVAATTIAGGLIYYGVNPISSPPSEPAPLPQTPKVTALGRLEPAAEVIRLAAPVQFDGDRIKTLLVQEGDTVQAGQVIAILDSHDRLRDAMQQAREQVGIAEAKLAQVRAGAKTGEIQAQQAEILRLQAELKGEQSTQTATIARLAAEVRNAQTEFDRFQTLHQAGAIAASERDSKQLVLETAQAQLQEAQAAQDRTTATLRAQIESAQSTLSQIAEVRPVDIQTAQAEVNQAIAALNQARTEFEQTTVRAPATGQILKIYAQPGEKIDTEGIADFGQTHQMMVVAEVYQSDISKITAGQNAKVTSQAFPGELTGTVSQIGLQVNQQNVFSNKPGENFDRRVIEVKIRLSPQSSQQVTSLTHLQVQVAIEL